MTAHQITVTNSVNLFGDSPSSLWNAYNWNAFKWGQGTATVPFLMTKAITNSLAPDSTRGFNFTHLIPIDDLTLDSGVGINFTIGISNSLSPTSDSSDQYLTDAAGYYHVFPGGVTDADNRVDSSWSQAAASSTAWLATAASSTSWSDG